MLKIKPATDLRILYEKGDSREELYSLLAEGRKSVEEGRVRPLDEAMADIRKRLVNGAI